jgi:nitrogen PTS system EIIA component
VEQTVRLAEFIAFAGVVGAPQCGSRGGVIRFLLERLVDAGRVRADDFSSLETGILRREELGSTGIGQGLAMPHTRYAALSHGVAALAVLSRPIDFRSLDGEPADLVLLQLAPPLPPGTHLGRTISPLTIRLMRCLSLEIFRARLREAGSAGAIRRLLDEADAGAFDGLHRG